MPAWTSDPVALHASAQPDRIACVDLASGRIIGLEALLRWNHPTKGMILPDRFMGEPRVGVGPFPGGTTCNVPPGEAYS